MNQQAASNQFTREFPSVWDSSMIDELKSCEAKANLSYLEEWKPKGQSVHLHAGAAFAHGLERTRKAFYVEGLSEDTAIAQGLGALVEYYGNFECPSDSAKSCERMCGAFEFYWSNYPLTDTQNEPITLAGGKRAIEFSFAEPLDIKHPVSGEPLIYTGRSDMVVEMSSGIFIEDDKTTSQLGASWSNQCDLRSQFSGYCWAAHRIGLPVDGVLIRGVAILKTMFKHEQYLTYRAQWEIDRWHEQLLRDIKRMIACWQEGYWDYNLADACGDFGGCGYRQVCKSNNPQEWLQMYFSRRRWDPITRTEIPLE